MSTSRVLVQGLAARREMGEGSGGSRERRIKLVEFFTMSVNLMLPG